MIARIICKVAESFQSNTNWAFWDFWSWSWVTRQLRATKIKIKNFLIVETSVLKLSGISRLSRCPFWNCWEVLDCRDVHLKLSGISPLSRCPFWNCREFFDCRDVRFETVENFSTVEMSVLKLSRCPFWNGRELVKLILNVC
jgi:hypothetical protein